MWRKLAKRLRNKGGLIIGWDLDSVVVFLGDAHVVSFGWNDVQRIRGWIDDGIQIAIDLEGACVSLNAGVDRWESYLTECATRYAGWRSDWELALRKAANSDSPVQVFIWTRECLAKKG